MHVRARSGALPQARTSRGSQSATRRANFVSVTKLFVFRLAFVTYDVGSVVLVDFVLIVDYDYLARFYLVVIALRVFI